MKATLTVAALLSCAGASAWNSALYPYDGTDYSRPAVNFNGRGWQLQDYSYSGYQLGAVTPGSSIPCANVQNVAASSDITSALQAAINTVGNAGGGTVVIPAGSFKINRSIAIPYSNVSIIGAGSNLTTLTLSSTYLPSDDNEEGVFTFGKAIGSSNKSWMDQGKVLTTVAQPVAEGDLTAMLADASNVKVGQWIVFQQFYWSALVRRNDSSGTWPSYDTTTYPPAGSPDKSYSFLYLRKITAISGKVVTLDAPFPFALDPANNPIGVRSTDTRTTGTTMTWRENIGLAGLSIAFADNDNGTGGFPVGIGVYFEGVRNGWVNDVQVQNFPRYGMVVNASARVTVSDSAVQRAQNTAGSGHGYGFVSNDSQNILWLRDYAEFARHGYTDLSGLNSVIVYSQSESAGSRVNADDEHYGLIQQVLWDKHRMSYGTGMIAAYRGTLSNNAQESNLSTVIWNPSDTGYSGTAYGALVSLNPSIDGYTMLIGGPTSYPVFDDGPTTGSGTMMQAYPGLQVGALPQAAAPGARDQNVLYEGLYQAGLVPASLWTQQTTSRLGKTPGYFKSSCVTAPPRGTIVRATYTGPGTLVFNGDQLGWSTNFGSACPATMENANLTTDAATCNTSSDAVNATAGGKYALALLSTNSAGSIVATLGGPTLATGSFSTLSLKVYPTSSSFAINVYLGTKGALPSVQTQLLGSYSLSGLQPNQWNTVSIPVSNFRSGSFNAVVFKSVGAASASQTWLDDIVLQ